MVLNFRHLGSFILLFIAELDDRTQFTNIVLATVLAFTFVGLLAGTLLSHAPCHLAGGGSGAMVSAQRWALPGVWPVLPQAGPGLRPSAIAPE